MTTGASVALCTHNGSAFIAEQLRSIVEQTVPPGEIVISDDASGDGTAQLVREFAATADPAIRFVVVENAEPLGVARDFEQAIRTTTGDFIALSDQDDVWHPGRLEAVLERFAEGPELLLVSGDARLVDAGGAPLGLTLFAALEIRESDIASINSGHALDELFRRNLVTGATTVIRRRLFDLAAPFPAPWVHDEWLAMIAAATGEIGVLAQQLTDYRQHGSNQIGAEKLGLRAKFGRLREPRLGRNEYLLDRASVLLDRLEDLGDAVDPRVVIRTREKVAHQQVRADLPTSYVGRIRPVLREAARGRYALYSRGWLDVARDLLQPA